MTHRLATLTRRLLGREHPPGGADTDRQLLERFVRDRDQAAFAALLERHGPMILAVCRRVLHNPADADDAFQATFLVLVRRAAAVGWHESLGGWLHAVAQRVARKVRARVTRTAAPAPRADPPEAVTADPPAAAAHRELRAVLDEELARLPEKYRLPLVLCYLEGWTNEEAAAQLGWTKGTVSGRLARARDLLRGRLARRGLALSVVALEIALSAAAAGSPPAALIESTLAAAALFASGTGTAGGVSARAITLSEGVSRAMFLTRVKMTTAALLAFCLLGTGATLAVLRARTADRQEAKPEPAPKFADRPAKPTTDDESLEGTWTITNAESLQRGHKWTFAGGRLEGYGEPSKAVFAHYKLDPAQKPKGIDLTVRSGIDGPVLFAVKGIYQLEGDELKIRFASKGEARPKAFPAEQAPASVLVFKREWPAKVTFLDTEGGKPPMRFNYVTLDLINVRDRPVWLVTRDWGDEPLTGSGKFAEQQDGTPQVFSGQGYNGKTGGGTGEAVLVRYTDNFRAVYLAPKATVRFERYTIKSWKDVEWFEVWEASALRVNGRTPLDQWLPYRTRNEGDAVIPAHTDWDNLGWDRKTSQPRKDYPNERIEFVQADVIKKWLVPIAKRDVTDKTSAKTPLEELQGTWHPVAGEFKGEPMTRQELEASRDKLVIEKDRFTEVTGDFEVESILKIDAAKEPRAFDLFSHTNVIDRGVKRVQESRIGQGIYALDGDTLKIAVADDNRARPTAFRTTADTTYAVITYKRGEPPARPDPKKRPEFVEAEVTLFLGRDGIEGEEQKKLKRTVKDKAALAKFVTCFPEMGRGKTSAIAGGWIPRVAVTFTGSKGETVTVNSTWTHWSEGGGDWRVKANLMKCTGELFEVPRLIDQGNLSDDWQVVSFEEGGPGA